MLRPLPLVALSALAVLLLSPPRAFAVALPIGTVSVEIRDGPPGTGDVLYDSVFGPVFGTSGQAVSFNGIWVNSPSTVDNLGGTPAGSADLLGEVLGSTLRAKADLSQNDQTVSGRRLGTATSTATASYVAPYMVSGPAGATGLVDVLLTGSLSGTFDIAMGLSQGGVIANLGAGPGAVFPPNFDAANCIATYQPGGAGCSAPNSLTFAQNGNLWTLSGTLGGVIQVPVNQISEFSAYLGVDVVNSTGASGGRTAALFDTSLTWSVASADPNVTLQLIPEPSSAALLGLALGGVAALRRREAIGQEPPGRAFTASPTF